MARVSRKKDASSDLRFGDAGDAKALLARVENGAGAYATFGGSAGWAREQSVDSSQPVDVLDPTIDRLGDLAFAWIANGEIWATWWYPPGPPTNQPPHANAGTDRSVVAALSTWPVGGQTRLMNINGLNYRGYRFPPEIISHVVWLYHRFCLSLRDVEDVMAERGILVSYETVRQWCWKFGPRYARVAKRRAGQRGDTWYLDEVFVTIKGRRHYLWRAADQDGDTLDILPQLRRNQRAAERFFRKLLKGEGASPRQLVTDKLASYAAARGTTMPSVPHVTAPRANNRAEASHQPTRARGRQMGRFKSPGSAQRFRAVHAVVGNLFRLGRHLLRAVHYRALRLRAFATWQQVTCA